ncbi:MAG: hypothetical protein COY42_28915 [Armatimonadetes bacterium CG_4_10_14_0_8_um_filter_66_14]|nr:hypothetical protein [Armatimonadota bacterium]OIP06371.1 MAG: hypothetical protein AUJ96_09230 [Armatimonadetes bacterium CG2_30_66_41]PIU92900.1 MAG: hypothetical protein COS65_15415 [Armatimonadetes bacterium CG06_land_8_20_14_3_00_66_21]PIX39133.1 MAG: hypothetical protein COZ57_28945 [Armatimonadetes bacterium CG_4_8_14_3_um_filter_66_20]PIZ34233.1 MAG: hypothetical protein COY42_28915 [Armatimonadetes bacterium CG_4_10_14_0_8_um_filter_66_14]PJB65265.1 MAG: hypothetical protein CO096_
MQPPDVTTVAGLLFALCLLSVRPARAAEQTALKHPVLDHALDPAKAAEYERAAARALALPEEELLSFVPDKPFTAYCECPNCYGGVEGNSIFTWTVDRPDEMKCRFCGTVVPSDKYPEDQVLTGTNKLGETVSFRYYRNKEKDIQHFFTGNLSRWQRAWLVQQCEALGKAYQATGAEKYARRVVLVLDRIAQVYPHYPVMQNLPRGFRFRESQDPPFAWDSGRWGCFHNEIPTYLTRAYDLVYDSAEFDRLSKDRGYDVRAKWENDVLRATFDAVAAKQDHVNNVVGYDVASAATLGRVIGEPRYVHWAFGWMKENVDSGFFCDAMWHEAPSYHYMTIGGLKSAFSRVQGYTDPPGYVDPVDRTRFDNLDPEKAVPFWSKCLDAPAVLDFPNGCSSCVHDTHPYEKRSQPRDATTSTIAPGFGHASLGRGTGADQMQAQLHFSGSYGHAHYDNLNLTLWAKEREMLPDVGYTWTQMRYWCTSTLGHNVVVVDRRDQGGNPSDGDLLSYFPDTGGVAVVEADGRRAYANTADLDTYRRLLMTVPVSETDAYVVDVFRVHGGTTHDWTLHGDADRDMTATCSLPLAGKRDTMLEPGEEWVEPTLESARFNPYGMLRELATGEVNGPFQTDFRYADEPTRGIRVHLLLGGPADVWLGKSPSVRRMGQGTGGDMRKAYDFWMPQLLVRRRGDAPLASTFVAVYEPYVGAHFLTGVEALPVEPAERGAIALRVAHGEAVDTLLVTLDEPPYAERATEDGTTLQGRLGVVRRTNGQATNAWLFEGAKLAAGKMVVDSPRDRYEGALVAVWRKADGAAEDALLTDAALPQGNALHGVWIIVTHGNGFRHGYEIDHIATHEGKTVIALTGDHGLKIDGEKTTEVYFPRRAMAGANTFLIPLSAAVSR